MAERSFAKPESSNGGFLFWGERLHGPRKAAIGAPEPERNADLPIGLCLVGNSNVPIGRSAFRFMGRAGVRGAGKNRETL
jgi:hypothetical protein